MYRVNFQFARPIWVTFYSIVVGRTVGWKPTAVERKARFAGFANVNRPTLAPAVTPVLVF